MKYLPFAWPVFVFVILCGLSGGKILVPAAIAIATFGGCVVGKKYGNYGNKSLGDAYALIVAICAFVIGGLMGSWVAAFLVAAALAIFVMVAVRIGTMVEHGAPLQSSPTWQNRHKMGYAITGGFAGIFAGYCLSYLLQPGILRMTMSLGDYLGSMDKIMPHDKFGGTAWGAIFAGMIVCAVIGGILGEKVDKQAGKSGGETGPLPFPANQVQASPVSNSKVNFCTNCGTSKPVEAKFCPNCGTPAV